MKCLMIFLLAGCARLASAQNTESNMLEKPVPPIDSYIHFYYGSFLAHANGTFEASREGGNPRVPQDESLSGGSVESIGITWGAWSGEPAFSFGAAIELGYLSYESESGNIDFDTLNLTGLLNIHGSFLKSVRVPHGRIRPYAGIGASFLWGDLDAQIQMDDGSVVSGDEVVLGVGLDVRTGLQVMITKSVGLFAEYRYLYLYVGSTSPESDWGFADIKGYDALDLDLGLGQAVVGVTISY